MTKKSTFLRAKPAGVLTSLALCPHLSTTTSPRVALFGELVFRELVHCNTSSNCEPAVKTQRFLLFYDWLAGWLTLSSKMCKLKYIVTAAV